MPKSRITKARGQKSLPKRVKFKLGGRKSTVSALLISTEDLTQRLESENHKRDHGKIRKVLHDRGVQVYG